jgi:hypothetical protein
LEPKFGQAEERGESEACEGSSCASCDGVWRMMFVEIVGKVGAAWLPVHMEMTLTDTVPHQIDTHVYGFGVPLFDHVVDDLWRRLVLGLGHFWLSSARS